ncbi:hypothetical protein DY000_02005565 [Brassica cretica]|uniref:Uncharacterized protein n=1 Tax=Brassica cretica TaxID=69181 RepID=A0ABQ7BX94_BRACR|nr:hypothetical protein DY000_02005565 [Brassica cretica]
MKVTVALLVNVCVDIVDVVGRVVDEDLVVSGCVDVVDVTGRVVDRVLGGGYESEELWTRFSLSVVVLMLLMSLSGICEGMRDFLNEMAAMMNLCIVRCHSIPILIINVLARVSICLLCNLRKPAAVVLFKRVATEVKTLMGAVLIRRDAEADLNSALRPVEIIGNLASIEKAEKLINEVIAQSEGEGIPAIFVGVIIGRGDYQEHADKVESTDSGDSFEQEADGGGSLEEGGDISKDVNGGSSHKEVEADLNSALRPVEIIGNLASIEKAEKLINEVIAQVGVIIGRGDYQEHAEKVESTDSDFDRYMAEIWSANPDLATYLENADVSLWSRVYCQGDMYNIKTSNIAESINSALKRARGFPVQFLLEFIREKLGKWFWKMREGALSLPTQHSRGFEYLLAVRSEIADTMTVQPIDGCRFFGKGDKMDRVVDLEHGKCDCGVYAVEKIPYSHAIAAGTSAVEERTCFPLDVKRGPARQKKSRWQSWLELSRMRGRKPRKQHMVYRCSKCKETGPTKPQYLQVSRPVFSLPEDLRLSRPEGRPVSCPGVFLSEDLQVSRPVFSLPEDLQLSHPEGRPVSRSGFFLPEDLQVSRPVFRLPEDLQLSRPEGRPVSRPCFFLPEDLQVSRPVFSLPEDLQLSRPEGRPCTTKQI